MNLMKVGSYVVEMKKSYPQPSQFQPPNGTAFFSAIHQTTNERCFFQFVDKTAPKEVLALTKEVKVQMLTAGQKSLDILRLREVLQDNPQKQNPSNNTNNTNNNINSNNLAGRKRSFGQLETDGEASGGEGSGDDGEYNEEPRPYKVRKMEASNQPFPVPVPPRYYLAFEGFANGEVKDLLQYIKEEGKIPEETARGLFRSLLQTIDSLHGMGVIHGDLKLPNILVYEDVKPGEEAEMKSYVAAFGGQVNVNRKATAAEKPANLKLKVKDFRYSTILTGAETSPNTVQEEGMITSHKGSPAYLAPEITVLNQPYCGKKADIYALGVILYTMLVGGYPITAPSLPVLLDLIRKGVYLVPAFISKEGADLINKLLEKDPDQRITAGEALKHPWFSQKTNTVVLAPISSSKTVIEDDEQVVPFGKSCSKEEQAALKGRKVNKAKTVY